MRRSYESPLPLQEGWSSLQTHSRARRDTHRGLALVSGRLGNLHARTALRACSKNLQIAPNCGSWASPPASTLHPHGWAIIPCSLRCFILREATRRLQVLEEELSRTVAVVGGQATSRLRTTFQRGPRPARANPH